MKQTPLTVQVLRDILAELPDDTLVVLAGDAEGNNYDRCMSFSTNMVYYDREIGLASLTPSLVDQGYTEEDVKTGEPCVVLWP